MGLAVMGLTGQWENSSVSGGQESESESSPHILVGQVSLPVGSLEGGRS